MDITTSFSEIIGLCLALAATGVAAGFLSGTFGVGGGAVIVPIMYNALVTLGFSGTTSIKVALGTSLAVIAPLGIRSFQAHRARTPVDLDLLRNWAIAIPAGVVLGAMIAAVASGEALRAIYVCFTVVLAAKLLFERDSWRIGNDLPHWPVSAAVGSGIGMISALMGIGGGVLSASFMTFYGRPIHQAVATSAGAGVLIALPGAVGYMMAGYGAEELPPLSIGYVNLLGAGIIIPLSLVAAPLGVRIAHAMSKRQLEIGFAMFLLLNAAQFAYSLL
jgi:uncharacterized membrane protein YfcA